MRFGCGIGFIYSILTKLLVKNITGFPIIFFRDYRADPPKCLIAYTTIPATTRKRVIPSKTYTIVPTGPEAVAVAEAIAPEPNPSTAACI